MWLSYPFRSQRKSIAHIFSHTSCSLLSSCKLYMAHRPAYYLFLPFLCIQVSNGISRNSTSNIHCIASERQALLDFKDGVEDPTGRLSSWVGNNCCNWRGLTCDGITNHITHLDLRNPDPLNDDDDLPYNQGSLLGEVSPSMMKLKHLKYLDLSGNYLGDSSIPVFIGYFKHLRYLNLSATGFTGNIPQELGNLSRLHYLDLYSPTYDLYLDDAQWLSGLSSLFYLDMSRVDLSGLSDWLPILNMLPVVREIYLYDCSLEIIPKSLSHINFTSLSVLDLSYNYFNTTIPVFLYNITSLEHLDLHLSGFAGPVSAAIGNMTSLKYLDMSGMKFEGSLPKAMSSLCNLQTLHLTHSLEGHNLMELEEIFSGCIKDSLEELRMGDNAFAVPFPDWISDLKHLRVLDLSADKFYGPIPANIGKLSNLQILQLPFNEFNETISESLGQLQELIDLNLGINNFNTILTEEHFANLTKLKKLNLQGSSLQLRFDDEWIPPFQLEVIQLRSCQLGPKFPPWLQTQEKARFLDIAYAGIVDSIPYWFWNFTSHLDTLYLNNNEIRGKLPRSPNFQLNTEVHVDMSSNHFEGVLPYFPSNVVQLYLWNNSFTGPIPPSINEKMPKLVYLSFAQNNLSGYLPADLCNLKELVVLDLSENHLIGEILDCWERAEGIKFLNLAGNKLFGAFPRSIGSLKSLQLLDLSNNDMSGELPEISMNLTQLWTLDLSRNRFTGRIPIWLGESLPEMRILSLHLNQFIGTIPSQMSNFTNLHVLDLSNNHLSGTIPRSFGNLIGMKNTAGERGGGGEFYDSTAKDVVMTVWLMTKGRYYAYDKLLTFLTLLDLSMNNLSGHIPNELMDLYGMNTLNLSGNHLTGEITERIGHLQLLETLDLSRNTLSGPIPLNLSSLNFLHHLNLSNNNLSGRIPSGGQLNTLLDLSIYAGNPNLCGDPLLRSCPGDEPSQQNKSRTVDGQDGDQEDDTLDEILLYVFVILGFFTGFWAVSIVLILNRRWRITSFQITDTVYDKIYVITVVNINKIKRILLHKGLIKNWH